jgi:ketopantoate reductase
MAADVVPLWKLIEEHSESPTENNLAKAIKDVVRMHVDDGDCTYTYDADMQYRHWEKYIVWADTNAMKTIRLIAERNRGAVTKNILDLLKQLKESSQQQSETSHSLVEGKSYIINDEACREAVNIRNQIYADIELLLTKQPIDPNPTANS